MKKQWITMIAVVSIMLASAGCLKESSTKDNPEDTTSHITVTPVVEATPF